MSELVIFGAKGGGKGGGGGSNAPKEAKDSLRTLSIVSILDMVSEGEIGGLVAGAQSIYLNDVPQQNPDGSYNSTDFTWAANNGTQAQPALAGFATAESITNVGVEVKKASPYEFVVSDTSADLVRVGMYIPQLTYQNPSNGDIGGTSVEFKIEVKGPATAFMNSGVAYGYAKATLPITGYSKANVSFSAPFDANARTITLQKQENGGAWVTVTSKTIPAGMASVTSGALAGSATLSQASATVLFENVTVTSGASTNYRATTQIVATGAAGATLTPSYVEAYNQAQTVTIKGKTTSGYAADYTINPAAIVGAGPWTFRVTRITDDSTQSNLQNKTYVQSYTAVQTEKLRYPNSALVGVMTDAKQFNSIPARTYDLYLKIVKVPVNYNPLTRVYTGSWNGTFKWAWTDNPAWCFYDLVINPRYGLGDYITEAQVDKWALYSIGQYCDEMVPSGYGYNEPRFTCNLYLQTRADAMKVLQDMASIFHGMTYWMGGSVTAVQDSPKQPIYQFNNANVEGGIFQRESSDIKARHNVALVSWSDPTDNYRTKVEYVSDESLIQQWGFINQTEVAAFGCTSRGQARRAARWILYTERFETNTVTFKVGADGAVPYPGCIIQISDANKAGERRGGRLVAATSTTATLDAPFTIEAGNSYALWVNLPNGTLESRTVTTGAGSTSTLTVSPAWSATPSKDAMYVLASTDLVPELMRVLAVTEDEQHQYTVTCLEYNASKFDYIENNEPLYFPDNSNLADMTVAPPAPTAISVSDSVYVTAGATIASKISLSWEAPAGRYGIRGYIVEYRRGNGNVIVMPEVSVPDAEITDVVDGELYTITVRSVNTLGSISTTGTEITYTPIGKARPPSDVTGLSYVVDPQQGVQLTWAAVPDVDIDYYEVRYGASWAAGTVLAQAKATVLLAGFTAGRTYHVKALDTTGNYSTNAATITPTVALAAAPTVTSAIEGSTVRLAWNAVAGDFATDEYLITASGMADRRIKGTSFVMEVDWVNSRVFDVRAVDIGGNLGAIGQTTVVVQSPAQPTVRQEVIDNNVLLRWTSSQTTLPITTYEVRRGSTWAGATVVGKVTAEFSAIFESVGGTYTYLVAGYDSAGNMSAVGSVTALVNQPPDYQLQLDYNTSFAGTLSSAVNEGGDLLMPVSTTETWQSHFTSRSWTSPQDQINAGFPIYIQPSTSSGYYEETVDYGTVLAGTKVTVTPDTTVIAGNPVVSVTISVKQNIGDAWTDYTNTTSVFVTNFRYVKFRVTVTADTGDDLLRLNSVNLRLDSKLKNDAGRIYANAADSGGTVVNFNLPFVDITSITVTPEGTTPVTAVYDFTDVPNPTSFKVLIFNSSGTRVSGYVSWSAKGV